MTFHKHLGLLVVALSFSTTIATAADINELAEKFAHTERTEHRLGILRQIEVEVRAGNMEVLYSKQVAWLAMNADVASAPESSSLLHALLASPISRERAVVAIGGRLSDSRVDSDTVRTWTEMLIEYDQIYGLPETVVAQMGGALGRMEDPTFRQRVFSFVSRSSWARANRGKFLSLVAGFLDDRFPIEDRLWALSLLGDAAKAGTSLAPVRGSLYQLATQDENAKLRVSAWPILIAMTSEEKLKYLRMDLAREIQSPDIPISLYTAEPQAREDGVRIIVDMWKPRIPDLIIDGLIGLVAATESIAALSELTEVRRVDGLDEQRMAKLRGLSLTSPESVALLEKLLIDVLQPGSLVGPLEAIKYSKSRETRRLATEQLLETYPEGAVPMSVAEAAYSAMRQGVDAGSPAIDLVVRADEPFSAKERKILALIDQAPKGPIVDALSKLHDGADVEFLVRKYSTNLAIAETFRSSLVSVLYQQTREGGKLQPETVRVLQDFGASANKYYTIGIAIQVLESIDEPVPWSTRIRSSGFQWDILFVSLILSWIVAIVGGILWLLLIAVPSDSAQVSRGSRVGSLVGWFAMAVLFLASTGVAILLSLGHSYAPKPGPAVPFYMLTLFLACIVAGISIRMLRKRIMARRETATA